MCSPAPPGDGLVSLVRSSSSAPPGDGAVGRGLLWHSKQPEIITIKRLLNIESTCRTVRWRNAIANCELRMRIANCECELRIANCELRLRLLIAWCWCCLQPKQFDVANDEPMEVRWRNANANCELLIANCELLIANCELRMRLLLVISLLVWHLMYKVVSRRVGGVSAVFWTTLGCGLFWVAMTVSWILSGRRLGLPLDHASLWAHSVQDSWCVKTCKYSLTNVHVV